MRPQHKSITNRLNWCLCRCQNYYQRFKWLHESNLRTKINFKAANDIKTFLIKNCIYFKPRWICYYVLFNKPQSPCKHSNLLINMFIELEKRKKETEGKSLEAIPHFDISSSNSFTYISLKLKVNSKPMCKSLSWSNRHLSANYI